MVIFLFTCLAGSDNFFYENLRAEHYIFSRPEDTEWAKEEPGRWVVESTTHQGTPGGPRRALMGCALLGAPLQHL